MSDVDMKDEVPLAKRGRVDEVDQLVDITGDGKLTKKCLKVGTGKRTPKPGAKVTVHYVGTLTTGTQFDSSRERGEPITFTIGRSEVIKGWDQGVATMRKGERSLLSIHHSLAYGEEGRVPTIPPAATLQFDIELISWSTGTDVSDKKNNSLVKDTLRAGEEEWTKPTYDTVCSVALYSLDYKKAAADDEEKGGEEDEEEPEDDLADFLKAHQTPLKDWQVTIGADDVPEVFETAIKNCGAGEVARFTAVFDPPLVPAAAPPAAVSWKDLLALANPQQALPDACSQLTFVFELKSFQQPKAFHMVKTVDEKLAEAEKKKNEGNDLYKQKKCKRAVAKYEAGLQYLDDTDHKNRALDPVRVPLLMNLAAAQIELQQYFFAEQNCTKALGCDPQNAKALCRRLKARRLRGDYENAKTDYNRVLTLDPSNATARTEMALIQKALNEQKIKDKATFGGMFEKLAKKAPLSENKIKPKKEEEDKQELQFLDSVPRKLFVTASSEADAVGEYHLNVKDTHRTYPIWHRVDQDPSRAAWRIFSDPYKHWKLGKLGEFEQGLGYVKSKVSHDTADASPMPHEIQEWTKVGTEEEGWIEDTETKISTKPAEAGPEPPSEPNPSQ
ncbi:FK506-binding protein 59 [Diplonema papillatum]|nr:FK506-binding protein 59 [Diplonema papillatum]KAJ9441594.1 FK506-binding protein 59 [Diplonema papillatum]|eukprot:gene22145-33978_t